MKTEIPKRKPEGLKDYISLAITTCGVGYLPLAPGTWGSIVGVLIYLGVQSVFTDLIEGFTIFSDHGSPTSTTPYHVFAWTHFILFISLAILILVGVWASSRATELLGNLDPSQAVIDEVMGQLVVFLFVPFAISWPLVFAGFILFRIFDIWKPYPIDDLQGLPAGIGICADDLLAGVYGGISLAFIYAVYLSSDRYLSLFVAVSNLSI